MFGLDRCRDERRIPAADVLFAGAEKTADGTGSGSLLDFLAASRFKRERHLRASCLIDVAGEKSPSLSPMTSSSSEDIACWELVSLEEDWWSSSLLLLLASSSLAMRVAERHSCDRCFAAACNNNVYCAQLLDFTCSKNNEDPQHNTLQLTGSSSFFSIFARRTRTFS